METLSKELFRFRWFNGGTVRAKRDRPTTTAKTHMFDLIIIMLLIYSDTYMSRLSINFYSNRYEGDINTMKTDWTRSQKFG